MFADRSCSEKKKKGFTIHKSFKCTFYFFQIDSAKQIATKLIFFLASEFMIIDCIILQAPRSGRLGLQMNSASLF